MLRRRSAGLGTTTFLAMLLCVGLGWTSSLRAQPTCMDPDGFDPDAACCEVVDPSIPTFPSFDLEPMRYFTWNRCSLARNKEVCASFGAPNETTECGVYKLPFAMRTCGQQATALFSGDLTAVYMRTFLETRQTGSGSETVQVWRFLLNGDLEVSPFVISRFGTNPHVPQGYADYGNQTYWAGYIDYRARCDEGGTNWKIEWVLNHECDEFAHPNGGNRPGIYNPERSFTMAPIRFVPFGLTLGAFGAAIERAGGLREVEYVSETVADCKQPSRPTGGLSVLEGECPCDGEKLPPQYSRIALFVGSDCGQNLGDGTSRPLLAKYIGFFPEVGGAPERIPALLLGDAEWLNGCDQANDLGYSEGVMVLSSPESHSFWSLLPGKAMPELEPIGPYFMDLASSVDGLRNPIQGAPHVSNRVGHLNFSD